MQQHFGERLVSQQWKWILGSAAPIFCYFGLYWFGFQETYRCFFSITLWAALAWAFKILPDSIVGLFVPTLFVLLKMGSPAQILSPWLTGVPWTILGGLAVGSVMLHTGLAKRLAFWCVLPLGHFFPAILTGLMLAGMVIAPFMPSALGKMAIMSVIGIGICDVLQLQPKSKAASAVMLTCFLAVSCPALSYATGGLHVAIAVGFLGKVSSGGLSWLDYAYHNWILGMVFSLASLLLVIFLLKPEYPIEETGTIRTRYEQLGAVSAPEKRTLIILALIMIGFVTDRIHGLDPAWIMILATVSFFLPGIRLMDGDEFGRLAFPLLFFITGAMSIGTTATLFGVSRWITEGLVPLLSGSSVIAVLVAYGFGIVSSFFIQSVALAGLFTPPLIDAALQLGVSPHAIIYSFLRGTDQAVFPYQFAVLAYVCSFGYISYRQVILVMSIRMVIDTCLFIGVAYPYWKWIGIV